MAKLKDQFLGIMDFIGKDIDDSERLHRMQQVYDAMLRIVWKGACREGNVGGQTFNIFRFKMMRQLREEMEILEQKVSDNSGEPREFVIKYEYSLPQVDK